MLNQQPKIFTGSKAFGPISGSSVILFTPSEFRETFGRSFNNSKDFVGVMNGDSISSGAHIDGAQWSMNNGVYATFNRSLNNEWIRVIFVVILGV